jgi:hypothetical protein
MADEWEFDEQRTCEEDIKKQVKAYSSRLATNLIGSGIKHVTGYMVDPKENHLCQCHDPSVTGASLQFERLAVITRCDKGGLPLGSKYHSMTPCPIGADPPKALSFTPSQLPPLTDIQADARKEFLSRFHATLRGHVEESSRQNPGRTAKAAKERNQAIVGQMRDNLDFSDMVHSFQYSENDKGDATWLPFHEHNTLFWPVNFTNQGDPDVREERGTAWEPSVSNETRDWVNRQSARLAERPGRQTRTS